MGSRFLRERSADDGGERRAAVGNGKEAEARCPVGREVVQKLGHVDVPGRLAAGARRRRPGRWTPPAELAFPREHRKRYAEFKRLRIGEDLVLDERTSRLAEKLTAAIS